MNSYAHEGKSGDEEKGVENKKEVYLLCLSASESDSAVLTQTFLSLVQR